MRGQALYVLPEGREMAVFHAPGDGLRRVCGLPAPANPALCLVCEGAWVAFGSEGGGRVNFGRCSAAGLESSVSVELPPDLGLLRLFVHGSWLFVSTRSRSRFAPCVLGWIRMDAEAPVFQPLETPESRGAGVRLEAFERDGDTLIAVDAFTGSPRLLFYDLAGAPEPMLLREPEPTPVSRLLRGGLEAGQCVGFLGNTLLLSSPADGLYAADLDRAFEPLPASFPARGFRVVPAAEALAGQIRKIVPVRGRGRCILASLFEGRYRLDWILV